MLDNKKVFKSRALCKLLFLTGFTHFLYFASVMFTFKLQIYFLDFQLGNIPSTKSLQDSNQKFFNLFTIFVQITECNSLCGRLCKQWLQSLYFTFLIIFYWLCYYSSPDLSPFAPLYPEPHTPSGNLPTVVHVHESSI